MSAISFLPAALDLADTGLPVFPCNPDTKAPLVAGGFKSATLDPARIRAWWVAYPGALVGVPTGQASGFDVLDIDPRHGGDVWLRDNEHRMRGARRHETRSGGVHILFDHEPALRCGTDVIAPGVDVRADGGYVIHWPSHGFKVEGDAPIPCPADLLAEILSRRPKACESDRDPAELAPPSADDAVDLLDALPNPLHVGRDEYMSVMLAARGCISGLEAAGQLNDGDEDRIAEAAIRWATRWEGYDGTDEAAKWADDWSQRDAPLAGWQTLQRHARRLIPDYAARQAAAAFADAPLPAEPEGAPVDARISVTAKPKLLPFLDLDSLDAQPDPEWLIDGLIPLGGLCSLYGPPKQGKSFLLLSAALHIAKGRDWAGRAVKQGAVVYIAGEGAGGLKLRMRAMREHYGIDGSGLPFIVIPRAVPFGDAEAVAALDATIRVAVPGGGIRMLVIDTLARATPGMDENSAGDMSRFVAQCDVLKEAFGCTVMIVHHSGKDVTKGSRGSSALPGAIDTSFQVSRKRDNVSDIATLGNEYQKDAEEAPPLAFDLVRVHPSLVPVLRTAPVVKERPLTRNQDAALSILLKLLADRGVTAIPEADWREAAIASRAVSGSENPKARREAFNDALKGLVRAGRVWAEGGMCGTGEAEFRHSAEGDEGGPTLADILRPDIPPAAEKAEFGRNSANSASQQATEQAEEAERAYGSPPFRPVLCLFSPKNEGDGGEQTIPPLPVAELPVAGAPQSPAPRDDPAELYERVVAAKAARARTKENER